MNALQRLHGYLADRHVPHALIGGHALAARGVPVVRITLTDGSMIDIVVGKHRWQQGVLDRADFLDVGNITVPVARSSDLILLKLVAGGPQDLADIRAILETADREKTIAEVRTHLGMLPEDCSETFERL